MGEPTKGHRDIGLYTKDRLAGAAANRFTAVNQYFQCFSSDRVKALSLGSQHRLTALPGKQFDSEVLFQGPNLMADSRVGQIQFLGGFAKTAHSGSTLKPPQSL